MQIRNLELLKLRFGENNLHFCEVMIKDIADSKRINTHIVSQIKRSRVNEGDTMVNHRQLTIMYKFYRCQCAEYGETRT